jgi:putative inorganic carbon (HCO3(-)) transporter
MAGKNLVVLVALGFVSVIAIAISVTILWSFDTAMRVLFVVFPAVLFFIEPFWGLLVYTVYFYVRPFDYVPALQTSRIMLMVGSSALLSMILKTAVLGPRLSVFRTPQDKLVVWFVGAFVMSNLYTLNVALLFKSLTGLFPALVLYYLIVNLVNSEKRLYVYGVIIVASTLVLAVQGIVQYYAGVGLAGQTANFERRIQALGTFSDPNAFAMCLLVGLAWSALAIGTSRRLLSQGCFLISAVAMVYAIYLTNSRGGMVTLGVVAVLWLLRHKGWKKGIPAGALVLVLVFVLGPSRMSTISTHEPSARGHLELWNAGLQIWKSHPILGIGADAWASRYDLMIAHNSFVHCAAELGLFGLVPWVALILVSLKNIRHVSLADVDETGRGIKVEAEKIYYAGLGYVGTALFISKAYSVLLMIIVAMSSVGIALYAGRQKGVVVQWETRDIWLSVGVTVLGLVALKILLMVVGV